MTRRELPEPLRVEARTDHTTPLETVVSVLTSLGVADRFGDVVSLHAHAQVLRAARHREPERLEQVHRDVVADLARGDLEVAGARARIAEAVHLAHSGASREAIGSAAAAATRDAWRRLGDQYGEAGLIAVLGPIADEAVAESVKLTSSVDPRAIDYPTAYLISKRIGETWSRLGELYTRWNMAHAVMDTLRAEDGLPVATERAWPRYLYPLEYRYRHPECSLDVPVEPHERFLARVVAAGAQPGMFTASDVFGHRTEDCRPAPDHDIA